MEIFDIVFALMLIILLISLLVAVYGLFTMPSPTKVFIDSTHRYMLFLAEMALINLENSSLEENEKKIQRANLYKLVNLIRGEM